LCCSPVTSSATAAKRSGCRVVTTVAHRTAVISTVCCQSTTLRPPSASE
jgi:hypothetical protein